VGNPQVRDHLEEMDAYWRTILKCIFKKNDDGLACIDLPQDRDRWLALVNAAMNLRFP
jgi:hypothetical protein